MRVGYQLKANLVCLALAMACAFNWCSARAAAPLPGSQIDNQAFGSFTNADGFNLQFQSEKVRLVVQNYESIRLIFDKTTTVPAKTSLAFEHRLSNPGNIATEYEFVIGNASGDNFDLDDLKLYQDVNGNLDVDSGDVLLIGSVSTNITGSGKQASVKASKKIKLGPGEFTDLLLTGFVPAATPAGHVARLNLAAFVASDPTIRASVVDTITVIAPIVNLSKVASTEDSDRNQVVTFTLTGKNTGDAPATGVGLKINGTTSSRVLIRDQMPPNTTFKSFINTSSTQGLYHYLNEPLNTYHTAPPSDLTRVDAIAFALAQLETNQTVTISFDVTVSSAAAGTFTNRAEVHFSDTVERLNDSNAVKVKLPEKKYPPTIDYYTSAAWQRIALISRLSTPLFVQATNAFANTNGTTVDKCTITLKSVKTGDRKSFVATETAANSGIFRIVPSPRLKHVSEQGTSGAADGFIQSVPNDSILATIRADGMEATSTLLVDPFGIVFNSDDDEPIAGAEVKLIDVTGAGNGGKPNQPAKIFEADGITESVNPLITGADGQYLFPMVKPSRYRLLVTPPAGYEFPSKALPTTFPSRIIDVSGSFGGNFAITSSIGTIRIDVPVDPAPIAGAILLEKTASRAVIELGDSLTYSVQIKNTLAKDLKSLRLTDDLPAGFHFMKGSARLDKVAIADPVGGAGPHLEFNLGTLPASATWTLTYRVRVAPGALQGNGINTVQARTKNPPSFSNVATARVRVEPGVFNDKGIIIGKIFIDGNRNGIQDDGEFGIPGVRLYMENGNFVVSDSEGKYSIYGISPRTHVLKVDSTTLPPGAKLIPFSTRHAGDGGSRFVDLKASELHKANFAVEPSPEVYENVAQRMQKGEVEVAEIEKGLKEALPAEHQRVLDRDYKALPATGVKGNENNAGTSDVQAPPQVTPAPSSRITNQPPNFTSLLPTNTLDYGNSNLPDRHSFPTRITLETVLTNIPDNSLGFVDLKDGDTLPSAITDVRIKGVMGSAFILKVNGEQISDKRIGKRASLPDKQLEAWEFISLHLKPGNNEIELTQKDPFGNERGRKVITVRAPDRLGKIKITVPQQEFQADGVTPVKILVEMTDDQGVPVTSRTPLTLETTSARWGVDDLNKAEPGTQVFIEGGRAEYKLLPPTEPLDAQIRVSSGMIESEAVVPFLPDLRPLIAAGVIEGAINLHSISASSLIPTRSRDGFEEELRGFAATGADGKAHGGGRVAFFLKGKIKGDFLLTAGYDSDKDTKERLFRDIEPDTFYPVYGDSSIKGYDAQSTGRLYVRVDKKKCYLLYGDFTTQAQGETRMLGNYNRSLTGIREHYENNRISANVWASEDSTRQVVEEIRANGTSGPFSFRTSDAIVNSEKVEILTRDRHQPSLILKTEPMTRFTDYEFEPFTGQLLFKGPIPSLDENLNPISIRVTYEVETAGDRFWVYGGDAQLKIFERWEVGASAVRDENPLNNYELRSANTTVKLTKDTYLIGEVAQSESDFTESGEAGRVELRHKGTNTEARVFLGKTDSSFTNSSSMMMPGRTEGGLKVTQRLTATTQGIAEGIYTEDNVTDGNRQGIRVGVEKSFDGNYRVEVGGRYSTETTTAASASTQDVAPNEVRSARIKVTAPVPKIPSAAVYGEYENDLVETENKMVALGAEYQLKNKGRLYARHEFINALGGPFELNSVQQQNTTIVGLQTEYMKDGHYFNEYRARDAFSGRESEAAVGLRNGWNLAEGVRLSSSFERVTAIEGGTDNESTAITGGLEYTRNPDWKGTARLEMRTSDSTDSLLNSLGYARKVSKDWTFLTRTLLYVADNKAASAEDRIQGRFQTGMAYRQTDTDRWSGLSKYEYRYEEGDLGINSFSERRQVHILSLDVNFQPAKRWILSGHYAGKLALEDLPEASSYHAHLVAGRAIYEITKRWDVGLNGSMLFSEKFTSTKYGLGPEVGFTIHQNIRLGLGYNFFGFRDRDLANQNYTDHGVYVNLRLKFDEGMFGWLKPKEEKGDE